MELLNCGWSPWNVPPDLVLVILSSSFLPSLPQNRIDYERSGTNLTILEMVNKTHGDTAFFGGSLVGKDPSQWLAGPLAPLTFAVSKCSIAAIKKNNNKHLYSVGRCAWLSRPI